MRIFDFRLRPPYQGFTKLGIYGPVCNEAAPQRRHGEPSPAAREKSLELFWREMEEAGIAAGVLIGRQMPDDTVSVSNDDIHDMAGEFPDKIIPFGSLDASRGVSATPKRCWAEIWSEPCFPVPRAARHIGPRFFKPSGPGLFHPYLVRTVHICTLLFDYRAFLQLFMSFIYYNIIIYINLLFSSFFMHRLQQLRKRS